MKRVPMTAVAVLTLALLPGVASAQTPPRPPGAEAPGGGGEEPKPGVKPGAPAHGGAPGERRPGAGDGGEPGAGEPGRPPQGQPQRPAQAKPGEVKPGEVRPDQPKPGEPAPNHPGEPGRPPGAAGGTGHPGAGRPPPHLAAAQRQQVVTHFRAIDVAPVRVDFAVRVGVAVPRTVVLQPVPTEIVAIVPEFEGFRFFVVPGEIVIVDPDTFEVVEVLPL